MTVSRGPYVRGVNWATYEFWTSASSRRLPPKALPPFETAKSCPGFCIGPKASWTQRLEPLVFPGSQGSRGHSPSLGRAST